MHPSPLQPSPTPSPLSRAASCPLAALAREAEGMIGRHQACDRLAREAADPRVRAAADREMDALGEALDRLAERAAGLPAGSREGALLALVLAAGEAEILAVSDDAPAPALERLVRHLWTARRALEREASLPAAVSEFWMPRRLAPG
ncbi:hypothetical protein [Salinarimonas rosea]|uniref:hypothetical protein n=1 Tax=Salinarimonas rosea TaxID=552063 RepID=UPI000490AE4C|nr:hypothetical protein [Salinarimonas rosea]